MKSISIKILKIMLLVVIGICLFSIASKVCAFRIEPGSLTIKEGDEYRLSVVDDDGKKMYNYDVDWSSEKFSIATVAFGVVKASKPGTTLITAKDNKGNTATCNVTVLASDAIDDGGQTESNSGEIDIAGTINLVAKIVSLIFNIIETFILPLLTSLTM